MSKKQAKFILKSIKTDQFALLDENYKADAETSFKYNIELKCNFKDKRIGSFIGFEFSQNDKQFIIIKVSCHFKFDDDSWYGFIDKKENKLILPKEIATHLSAITISTTRGVLHSKVEGTVYSKFLVPLMDISKVIEENVEFAVE